MSILKRKKRKRVGLVEFWRIIKFLPQKYNSWWTIKKPHLNQLKLHIPFIGGKIASYIKLGLILISFAWGFNSRFNSAAETLLLVNHKKTTLESIETSYYVYWGDIAPYIKFGLIWISFSWCLNWRFNSAANWSYKEFGYLDIIERPINWHLLFSWYQNTIY
jgi:hypothetical protein